MRSGRAPASATSRHYAEPIPADDGGDYDLAGRDSNDLDEGYMHRVRPREDMVRPAPVRGRHTSDMSMASIDVRPPNAAPRQAPAPPYVVSREKPRRRARDGRTSPLAAFAADPLAGIREDREADTFGDDDVDDYRDDDGYGDAAPHGPNARRGREEEEALPSPRSSTEKRVSFKDEVETDAEINAETVFHAELDVDFRETKDRCDAVEAAAEYAEELAAETAHAMDTVLAMAQGRIDEAHGELDRLEKELAAEQAARRAEQEAFLEELVQARQSLVAAEKRGGRPDSRHERELDDAIQRLSQLQWLGDGNWFGHNQVEGPPTVPGPVEGYASPQHQRHQARARRAAAARVAAQREDSFDLAPEHPGRSSTGSTPRNRSSTGSSSPRNRSSTGSDRVARFEAGDY